MREIEILAREIEIQACRCAYVCRQGSPYVGPRLQRSHRQNRNEDFDFGFDEAEIQEHAVLFCGQLQ